jgi:ATP-dependent RNA helicase RhlE
MNFESLGLSEAIVRSVKEYGYTEPTPIQAQAIPAVLSGGDLLAAAQTGTGKTAGFVLPILQRLSATEATKNAQGRVPIRALILTPTRELAAQVEESVITYSKHLKLRSMAMFGGVSINPQKSQLNKGIDILVATPGRLLDHLNQRSLELNQVEIFVLDEADRMLDMGFIRDIKKVMALLPRKRQNLLFSATFSDEIKALADGLLNSPAVIEVARRNATAELITQKAMMVEKGAKRALLAHLIKQGDWHQVLVFCRTKHGANRLAEQLNKDSISAMAIHGNKSQGARTRALSEFKSGTLQVLVATDIAARGLDIELLPHVVNFELPNVAEDYVHRIGRTGRAGASGEALSLVSPDEYADLKGIERLIKQTLPRATPVGFVMPTKAEMVEPERPPRPPQNRSRNDSNGRSNGRSNGPSNGASNSPSNRSLKSGPKPSVPTGAARRVASGPPKAVAPSLNAALTGQAAKPAAPVSRLSSVQPSRSFRSKI